MFAEDITSANIVGFQDVAVPSGFCMRTSTFKALTGDYKISDIKVTNCPGGGGDMVQLMNSDGTWGNAYYYLTMDGTGYVEDGWYKDDGGAEAVTDEDVIKIGQSFIVTSSSDFDFTFAGEVITGKPEVTIPAGFSIVGNPTPVEVKISGIEVIDCLGGGGDVGQKMNADGTWGDAYYYLTMDGTGYVEDGWYKDDGGAEAVTDEDILAAGDAMIFTATGEFTIKFPAAL